MLQCCVVRDRDIVKDSTAGTLLVSLQVFVSSHQGKRRIEKPKTEGAIDKARVGGRITNTRTGMRQD